MNCPLAEAFTKTSSVLYQNFFREFWCIAEIEDPNPSKDDFEVHPLKEFIIKFTVMNGKNPLTLDFKTFFESTNLDYNQGNYVDHPSPKVVKAELAKIAINEALIQKNPVLKISFSVAWRILLTFFVQVPSKVTPIKLTDSMIAINNLESLVTLLSCFLKKVKKKSLTVSQPKPKTHSLKALGALPQKRKKPKSKKTSLYTLATPPSTCTSQKLPEDKPTDAKDSGGNKQPDDMGLYATHLNEGISTTKPLPEGTNTKPKDSERLKPLDDWDSSTPPLTALSGTNVEYQLDFEPLKLTTMDYIQALLIDSEDELIEASGDDVFEAEERWMKTSKSMSLKKLNLIIPLKHPLKNLIHKNTSLLYLPKNNLNPQKLKVLDASDIWLLIF
ncbi:hypothetical protein Tco_1209665 [Tanacetum coccineum]